MLLQPPHGRGTRGAVRHSTRRPVSGPPFFVTAPPAPACCVLRRLRCGPPHVAPHPGQPNGRPFSPAAPRPRCSRQAARPRRPGYNRRASTVVRTTHLLSGGRPFAAAPFLVRRSKRAAPAPLSHQRAVTTIITQRDAGQESAGPSAVVCICYHRTRPVPRASVVRKNVTVGCNK